MTNTICSAGSIGINTSYVIVKAEHEVIAALKNNDNEIITYHTDMNIACRWTEKQIQRLRNKQYEII